MANKTGWYAERNRGRCLAVASACIIFIAIAEWYFGPDVGLGFAYLVPLILAAAFLNRLQLISLALVCTALSQLFLPAEPEKWARVAFALGAYILVALIVREMVTYRRAAHAHVDSLGSEIKLLQEAGERTAKVINSCSAGLLLVSESGEIIFSNATAHRIFGVAPGALAGENIAVYLPGLAELQNANGQNNGKITVECEGRRCDGRRFPALVSLSSCDTASGKLFAMVVMDAEAIIAAAPGRRTTMSDQ